MRILVLLLLAACGAKTAPQQPIAFDHSIHTQVKLDSGPLQCTFCHAGVEKGARAQLPGITTCLRCHMRPQGDPPGAKDQIVREKAAQGGPFKFIQVTQTPGHVYFAHAPHVMLAKIQCSECHGDVTQWKTPPTEPVPGLVDMDHCLACHRERGAPTTCGTCHQ